MAGSEGEFAGEFKHLQGLVMEEQGRGGCHKALDCTEGEGPGNINGNRFVDMFTGNRKRFKWSVSV